MLWAALATIGVSFVISFLATSLSRNVAHRLGMLDRPGRHKVHAAPVPMLGGSAIFATFAGVTLLATAVCRYWAATGTPDWLPAAIAMHVAGVADKAPKALAILAGALVLHVVGLIDDRRNLGPWLKLVAQLAVAFCVVFFCDVRALTLAGRAVSVVVSVLWLVTIINAFNFLDNMDGLAGGVAAIVAAALISSSAQVGQLFVPAWLCALLGAICGFMVFNFPPARVFMGDAGSLVIGYMLAVLTCLTTYVAPDGRYYAYGVFVPLVLMAVPLYDMGSVILLRLRDRRNPMVGDRRHFSHRLLRKGMTVRKAVLTIYLCTAATAISATLLSLVGTYGAVLVFAQTVMVVMVLALLELSDGKPAAAGRL
jgi:UDP-GlcNAc:undecaprenyl-phosphate GlcNAc-1-phosphate transferase